MTIDLNKYRTAHQKLVNDAVAGKLDREEVVMFIGRIAAELGRSVLSTYEDAYLTQLSQYWIGKLK